MQTHKSFAGRIGAGLVGMVATIAPFSGCGNTSVPAGHEGYTYHRPLLIGKDYYVGTVEGPSSTGLVWRQFVDPVVDIRPTTYSEDFELLTSDNLNISFKAHAIIKLKEGSCKDVVEKFGGADWFKRYVQEPYRTIVREAARSQKAYDIQDKSDQIGKSILEAMRKKYDGTPIVVESISMGKVEFPVEVKNAVALKLAKEQELQRKDYESKIADKDAEIRIKNARGIAESQRIIDQSLTPNYLQFEAIKTQEKLASSPNTTVIYIPIGASGIPIVHNSEAQNISLERKVSQPNK
jgi:regulator of protease activity HflC (stomatin/prohibitin superfamily)